MAKNLLLRETIDNEKGGGNILLVFVITTFVLILIGGVAQYSLVHYRTNFRVKESIKMWEVMEQMGKVIRSAYEVNVANNGGLNNPGCPGGTVQQQIDANGKTTYLCFSNTLADRCVSDPTNPANPNRPFCILNFDAAVDIVKNGDDDEIQFTVKIEEEMPAIAKVGKFFDEKLVAMGFSEGQQKNLMDALDPSMKKAYAQVTTEQIITPPAPNAPMSIVSPNCTGGNAANFQDNLCIICSQPVGGDRRDNIDTTVNATADFPVGPAGARGASVRCMTFKVCALWAVDDPANPAACAANGYWYQKIALISYEKER